MPAPVRSAFHRKPADWDEWPYIRKMQWRCVNPDPSVDYARFADKHGVKEIVAPFFPTASTYLLVRRPAEIRCRLLPATYVMKCTNGWNMALLVEDGIIVAGNRERPHAGEPASDAVLREIASAWLDKGPPRRELQYRYLASRILFEEYLHPIDRELRLFLFDGIYRAAIVQYCRFYRRDGNRLDVYDQHWRHMDSAPDAASPKAHDAVGLSPDATEALFHDLHELCGHIDHVRADLYVCNGKAYFSEFTFTHNAGKPGTLENCGLELGGFWRR